MSPHWFATHLERGFSARITYLAVLLACVVILAVSKPALANSDVFEVTDVPVDATAESAAAARESALAAGQREAFARLLRRLTLRENHAVLPIPDANTVSTYVRDFSVSDEKTSSVRYLAKMHVRFKSADIRALLTEFGLPFAETISKPIVIVPILEYNGALMLWEDANRWRNAWLSQPAASGLTPLVHPLGDITDIDTIGPRHAINGDRQRLSQISKRYGTTSVVVTRAVLGSDVFSDLVSLDVYVTRYGMGDEPLTQVMTFSAPATDSVETLLSNAALRTAEFIEDNWKQENLMRAGEQGILAVAVPISGLPNWLAVQQRISGIAVIKQMEIVLISRDEVRLNLHFMGDVRQLVTAFAQADLDLIQTEGGWNVTPLP